MNKRQQKKIEAAGGFEWGARFIYFPMKWGDGVRKWKPIEIHLVTYFPGTSRISPRITATPKPPTEEEYGSQYRLSRCQPWSFELWARCEAWIAKQNALELEFAALRRGVTGERSKR